MGAHNVDDNFRVPVYNLTKEQIECSRHDKVADFTAGKTIHYGEYACSARSHTPLSSISAFTGDAQSLFLWDSDSDSGLKSDTDSVAAPGVTMWGWG